MWNQGAGAFKTPADFPHKLIRCKSKFPLTSSLLCHPLLRLKIKCLFVIAMNSSLLCSVYTKSPLVTPLSPLTRLRRIGLLLLGKPLDRESTDQYRLIVTASDGNPGGVRQLFLFLTQ